MMISIMRSRGTRRLIGMSFMVVSRMMGSKIGR